MLVSTTPNKDINELYTKFHNDLISIGLSDSNIDLINTYSTFSTGNNTEK